MVCTYEEYLKQPKAITFGKMQIFHAEMLAEIGADTEALELYDELMKVATRYAAIRANRLLLSREEKSEQGLWQDFLPQLRDNAFQYAGALFKTTRQSRRMA